MRICSRKDCLFFNQIQPIENFSRDGDRSRAECKSCKRVYSKKYYTQNQKQLQDRAKQYSLGYYQKNKSSIQFQRRKRDVIRRKEDIGFKIKCNLRRNLLNAMRKNYKSGSAVADLMMSIDNFKIYLEERFYPNPDTGEIMSWGNYGSRGWHIDHILPLCSFNLIDRKQLLTACHYSNLRPMWAKQNISEGGRGMSLNKKR